MKAVERERAILLRREGKTYFEILTEIPVAKSTLSEWLKSVRLAKSQKQRITKKRMRAALRGAQARRRSRISEVRSLERDGLADVGKLSDRELWLIGIALYWAEGSKQYDHSPSTGVLFNNSDSRMIRLFLRWLKHMEVSESAISFELYVHEVRSQDAPAFKRWWSHQLGIPVSRLGKIYFKKGNPKTKRKNTTDLYHGLIRIRVNSSTTLNRKINGWVHGIVA